MDTSDLVAFLSFLAAVLSAVYAKHSATEAKYANKIATHDKKLELYDNYRKFRAALAINGEQFSYEYLSPLMSSSQNAKFYFPKELADNIQKYANQGFDIMFKRDRIRRLEKTNKEVPTEMWDEVFALVDACRELEDAIEQGFEGTLGLVNP